MLQIRAESVKLYEDVNNVQNRNAHKKGDTLCNTIFFFCSLELYLSWESNNGLGLFWLVDFHLPSSLKKVKPGTVFGDQTSAQTDW